MESRLIFLRCVPWLNRRGRCPGLQPTTRTEGARKGEADLLPKWGKGQPRKAVRGHGAYPYRKLTQVGEARSLTALERTVLKELGNLTP